MSELNDIGVSVFIILLGLDVWITYKIYNNEYKGNENTKDKKDI